MKNSIELRPSSGSHRFALTLSAVCAAIGTALIGGGAAFASAVQVVTVPADPTGGQMDTMQTGVQGWVLTYGVPVLFGLTLLGILIRTGTKWVKRAARSV